MDDPPNGLFTAEANPSPNEAPFFLDKTREAVRRGKSERKCFVYREWGSW